MLHCHGADKGRIIDICFLGGLALIDAHWRTICAVFRASCDARVRQPLRRAETYPASIHAATA